MSEDFSDTPLVRTKCPVDAMASPHYIFASWKNIVTSLKNEVDDDSAKKISLYGEVWMLQYVAIRKKNLRYGQKDISKSRKPLYPADMKTGRKNGTADKIEERTRSKEEVKKGIWNQKKVLCLIMMLLGNISRDGKREKRKPKKNGPTYIPAKAGVAIKTGKGQGL